MDLNRTILDRTALDNRKQEEKELHDILYKKLQALTVIHRPTDDFKSVLTKDMFLKSNPKACIYVMHFLLTLYMDQDEFKMKFFWPIKDKKSESIFRSSVVSYLTELNEKHHLNWVHLKNYLISVPGGMKFITFLLEFINFIVAELTKKREKELQIHHHNNHKIIKERSFTKCSLNDILKEVDSFKKTIKEYEERVDSATSYTKQNIEFLNSKLNDISIQTKIPVKQLTDKRFLMDFSVNNQQQLQDLITKSINPLQNMENPLQKLKKHMETCQEHLKNSFDKDKLEESFIGIQKAYPEQLKELKIFNSNEINTETLLSSINLISPEIYESFRNVELNTNVEHLKFEESELNNIMKDLTDLEYKINDFKQLMNDDNVEDDDRVNNDGGTVPLSSMKTPSKFLSTTMNTGNVLHSNFINTPPIPILNNLDNGLANKQRLPLYLWNDNFINESISLSSSIRSNDERLNLLHSSHSTKKHQNTTILSRSSCHRKKGHKLHDPVHMLKAIAKRNSTKKLKTSSPLSSSRTSLLLSKDNNKKTSQDTNSAEKRKKFLQQQEQKQQFISSSSSPLLLSSSASSLIEKEKPLTTNTVESISKKSHEIYCTPTKLDILEGKDNDIGTGDEYDIRKISTSPSGRINSIIQFSITSSSPSFLSSSKSASSSSTLLDRKYSTKIHIKEKSLISEQSSSSLSSTDNLFNKSILEETEINIKIKNLCEIENKNIPDLLIVNDNNQNDNNQNNNDTNSDMNDVTEKLCSEFIDKLNLNFNDSLCNTSDTVLNDLPAI